MLVFWQKGGVDSEMIMILISSLGDIFVGSGQIQESKNDRKLILQFSWCGRATMELGQWKREARAIDETAHPYTTTLKVLKSRQHKNGSTLYTLADSEYLITYNNT